MVAFIPLVPSGSFASKSVPTPCVTATSSQTAPKMTANWPDDPGPAYSKYLPFISADRINKAPIITINKFPNEDYNNVSCQLAYLEADEGAGDSLKAGLDISDQPAPSPSLYSAYYSLDTIHEAPYISIYGDSSEASKKEIFVQMMPVPLSISTGKSILDGDEPDPSLYLFRYKDYLNKAPNVQLDYKTSDDDSSLYVDFTYQPRAEVAAAQILAEYRR